VPAFSVLWNYTWTRQRFPAFATNSVASAFISARRPGVGSGMTEAYRPVSDSLAATFAPGFARLDFYDRVHLKFLRLDLGNLVSDQTQTLWVWNAWRRAVSMTSISATNAEGVTLSGSTTTPVAFAPLESKSYQLGVSAVGPTTINATLSFGFSTGQTPAVVIVGSRIVAWVFAPDWSAGILERLEWRTDILRAYRGEEQRRALRIDPRQTLEFTVAPTDSDRRRLETLLWGWGSRTVALPLWFDGLELAAPLAAGSSAIPLDPSGRQFAVGDLVMLRSAQAAFEVGEVATVSAGSIGLSRPTIQSWAAGTRVYPARRAKLLDEAKAARFTGSASTMRLRFEMQDPAKWASAASPTYRGAPVLEEIHDWSREPETSFSRQIFVFDPGTGKVLTEDTGQMVFPAQRMRYLLAGRAALDTWRKRLFALRGKQGAVWVPSFSDDLELAATVLGNATQIDVAWCGLATLTNPPPVQRRDIRIRLFSGSILYRRILSVTELSSSVERLSIDSALGAGDVTPAQVAQISYMALSRADTDTAEFAWWDGETAEAALSLRAFRTTA